MTFGAALIQLLGAAIAGASPQRTTVVLQTRGPRDRASPVPFRSRGLVRNLVYEPLVVNGCCLT
jgi:hypothetical protein